MNYISRNIRTYDFFVNLYFESNRIDWLDTEEYLNGCNRFNSFQLPQSGYTFIFYMMYNFTALRCFICDRNSQHIKLTIHTHRSFVWLLYIHSSLRWEMPVYMRWLHVSRIECHLPQHPAGSRHILFTLYI